MSAFLLLEAKNWPVHQKCAALINLYPQPGPEKETKPLGVLGRLARMNRVSQCRGSFLCSSSVSIDKPPPSCLLSGLGSHFPCQKRVCRNTATALESLLSPSLSCGVHGPAPPLRGSAYGSWLVGALVTLVNLRGQHEAGCVFADLIASLQALTDAAASFSPEESYLTSDHRAVPGEAKLISICPSPARVSSCFSYALFFRGSFSHTKTNYITIIIIGRSQARRHRCDGLMSSSQ